MDTWHGHFSIMYFVLSALLNNRSSAGDLSESGGGPRTACEFCYCRLRRIFSDWRRAGLRRTAGAVGECAA
jgi:hypothetical protein